MRVEHAMALAWAIVSAVGCEERATPLAPATEPPPVALPPSRVTPVTAETTDGWPAEISYARLGVSIDEMKRQQWDFARALPDDIYSAHVERHAYFGHGPVGHGMVTTVYALRARRVFYLHADCVQGHADGILGPFVGDPRDVLARR